MNIEKIISDNPQLSLKSLGLITYLSVKHPDCKVAKYQLKDELNIGVDALRTAFSELQEINIIKTVSVRNNEGKFEHSYELNEIYR